MGKTPVIEKIKKLLILANDQEGTPEGELACRMAVSLMHKNAIDESAINGSHQYDDITRITMDVGRTTWRAKLAWTLMGHTGCTGIRRTKRINMSGAQGAMMLVWGFKHDISVLEYLYTLCERQIDTSCKKWVKKMRQEGVCIPYGEGQRYRESMVEGLRHKLWAIRKEEEHKTAMENENFSMVMVSRADAVKNKMNSEVTIKKTYKGGHKQLHAGAYLEGTRMNINKAVENRGSYAQEE